MTLAQKWRQERDAKICGLWTQMRIELPNEGVWTIVKAIADQTQVTPMTVKNALQKYNMYNR